MKVAQDMMAELKDRKDLTQITFENNEIRDVQGVCTVFKYFRNFERLESLNLRCNKNFDDEVLKALAEGITLKKELRVSGSVYAFRL
jgi:hypothetical protein